MDAAALTHLGIHCGHGRSPGAQPRPPGGSSRLGSAPCPSFFSMEPLGRARRRRAAAWRPPGAPLSVRHHGGAHGEVPYRRSGDTGTGQGWGRTPANCGSSLILSRPPSPPAQPETAGERAAAVPSCAHNELPKVTAASSCTSCPKTYQKNPCKNPRKNQKNPSVFSAKRLTLENHFLF